MPLIGFGVAIALLGSGKATIAALLFLLGTVLGFYCHRAFVTVMAFVPNAADHLFLASPIALIAAGLLLISPTPVRGVFAVPAALIIGAMLAQTISLTDPTINGWTVSLIGVALGLWVIVTIALCIRAFYRPWFFVAARIVGSWLLAIGLLYGSAAFVVRTPLSLPDTNLMPPSSARALPDVNTNPSGPEPEQLPTEP
ncbi:MAG: hypothetical protein JSR78_10430 [Proteobacteria bacterium]|nr:hypothetical protein [Pseudomonadota bacterium]